MSVNRELRRWSAEHGDGLWQCVELSLTTAHSKYPASWAGAQWLQGHTSHVRNLRLIFHQVLTLQAMTTLQHSAAH